MLLRVDRLRVQYGQIAAVVDASLEVDSGEIVALLGPNGAGKTTLLRAVGGLLRAASGEISFDGRDITRIRGDLVARCGISLVPEDRGIFPALSVEDNLRMGGYWAGEEYAERFAGVVEYFPVLAERRRQQAASLSGGEQQQLAIARALMARPRLLMLDEMSLGLAPRVVGELFDILRRINAAGTAVLVVEQHVTQALALAHRVYVMQRGRVVLGGTSEEVGADAERLSDAYLGGRATHAARPGAMYRAEEGAGGSASREEGDGEDLPPRIREGAGGSASREEGDGEDLPPRMDRLDVVELETLTVPLTLRDRRTLQVLADRAGEPVGALVARLIADHAAESRR